VAIGFAAGIPRSRCLVAECVNGHDHRIGRRVSRHLIVGKSIVATELATVLVPWWWRTSLETVRRQTIDQYRSASVTTVRLSFRRPARRGRR
jgi:hypothetical protein